jgi:hypothetical protein
MPIDDIDVWRAANILVKQHGENAALVAAQRADELLAQGDIEGEIVWKQITAAVSELQRKERRPDEKVN